MSDRDEEGIGRAPHWWENLLKIVPRVVNIKGAIVLFWLGGIVVLHRPKE